MATITEAAAEILAQDRVGRIRTPREQREKLLDEFERSGMRGTNRADK